MSSTESSDFFYRAGNHALQHNPPHGLDIHLTKRGSDWLWAVFALFGCLVVIYTVLFFIAQFKGNKVTRFAIAVPFLISLFEFFGYFIYASDLGWTGVQAEFNNFKVHPSITGESPGIRQVFYAKYVAWFLCWPLLLYLVDLTGLTTTEGKDIEISALEMIHSLLVQIVGTEFWVVSLLIGSLLKSTYKWGPWVFAAVTMLIVQGIITKRQFFDLKIRGFTAVMILTSYIVVWLYFISWGLSEGGNKIQPDGESVFYGVLDICMFAILPAYLLFIVSRYGEWPEFSLQHNVLRRHNDEEANEKGSEPSSIRASGETAVPVAVDDEN